jgi:hypothetical protein
MFLVATEYQAQTSRLTFGLNSGSLKAQQMQLHRENVALATQLLFSQASAANGLANCPHALYSGMFPRYYMFTSESTAPVWSYS